MKFQDLPKYVQDAILNAQEITGFKYFMVRKTERGNFETDAQSFDIDEANKNLGWVKVLSVPSNN